MNKSAGLKDIVCRRICVGILVGFTALAPPLHADDAELGKTTFRIVKDGHGPTRDLVIVAWRRRSGDDFGDVEIPVTSGPTTNSSLGRIGPLALKLPALGSVPNAYEWDTREWQWWKGFSRPFGGENDEYTRLVPADGGAERKEWGVRVWSRYVSDGVQTTQEWFFADLDQGEPVTYDCLITIQNVAQTPREEYGQFFATYVAWNQDRGHFYWAADGQLVNYLDRGARGLNYFVTARGSPYEKLGHVPHCARGGGKVKAVWQRPISVSHPGPRGFHHVQMTEEAVTAALGMGGRGYAQDYILAPPGMTLATGASFRAHVRHVFVKPTGGDWPKTLNSLWDDFSADHEQIHKMTSGGR